MRNDRERRECVDNQENWETIHEMPGIRIRQLSYKDRSWFKLEIWQTSEEWDWKKDGGGVKRIERTLWREVRIFTLNETTHAYGDAISVPQIVEEIKKIDKEEKQK